jgi:hypothetical protein
MRHDKVKVCDEVEFYFHAIFTSFVDRYVIGLRLRPLYSSRTDQLCSLVGGWAVLLVSLNATRDRNVFSH